MGDTFAEVVQGGPFLLALGAALLAGLVSFLSPCVLPLVPGYLSYVTGLAGSQLDATGVGRDLGSAAGAPADRRNGLRHRLRDWLPGRVLLGTLLFVAGFTVVFTTTAILFANIGRVFFEYQRALEIGIGALIILLGLAFLGLVPGLQREFRIQRLPSAGLLGAPVFGAVFALSWVPCTGPTLGAVLLMSTASGQTNRAVLLAVAYCFGLGLPFVAFGVGFNRLLGVFKAVRRNSRWVTRAGGALLILIGLALVTGGWQTFVIWLQTSVGVGEVFL